MPDDPEPNRFARDSRWAHQIREDSESAFEALYHAYFIPLLRFCGRFISQPETAETIVQETFWKIWQNRARLNPSASIRSYLYTIVRNQALQHLRRQRLENSIGEILIEDERQPVTPEEVLHSNELRQQIESAINHLPERCRLIFAMNRFDSLTYSEIAEVLGISLKTVETQMGRALKSLRHQLAEFL